MLCFLYMFFNKVKNTQDTYLLSASIKLRQELFNREHHMDIAPHPISNRPITPVGGIMEKFLRGILGNSEIIRNFVANFKYYGTEHEQEPKTLLLH